MASKTISEQGKQRPTMGKTEVLQPQSGTLGQ
jgi:hypothetical protein